VSKQLAEGCYPMEFCRLASLCQFGTHHGPVHSTTRTTERNLTRKSVLRLHKLAPRMVLPPGETQYSYR